MADAEHQPLLEVGSIQYDTLHDPYRYPSLPPDELGLSVPSTLPGTAPQGKTLTWSSAYILVVSRVIGSGVFATPGSIVKSVGSIGLTLVVWLIGTALAACGLAVSMEYGCMLPRSGGGKVNSHRTAGYV